MTSGPHMMTTMLDYTGWAFERVWKCIDTITDEQFCHETGFSMGSIRNQMVHVISATRRWVQRLEGAPLEEHLKYEDFPTRASVRPAWDGCMKELRRYVATLDDAALQRTIHWELPVRGMKADTRVDDALLHVFNHATDHRTQILAMLHYSFDAVTVEQDLIFYLVEQGG